MGTQLPDRSHAVTTGVMHSPGAHGLQSSPHVFPAQGSTGAHVKVPAVTHSLMSLHAVAANVGTGQVEGSAPGGQYPQ